MDRLLRRLLSGLFRHGNLHVTTAGGASFALGDGGGRRIAVRFTSRAAQLKVLFDPELNLGETYMDGGFVVEEGSIADLLALALSQDQMAGLPHWMRPQWLAR